MEKLIKNLPCDGCGLAASPEHIAARVQRLEQSTQFRPIHTGTLFVALAPPVRTADDFYSPSGSNDFFDPFLEALDISRSAQNSAMEEDVRANDLSRIAEFQRRGFFLAYLSECPLPENTETPDETIRRLGATLVRRIKFNYRPKQIAVLGHELSGLIAMLKGQGFGSVLTTADGQPLPIPGTGSAESAQLFRRSVTAGAL